MRRLALVSAFMFGAALYLTLTVSAQAQSITRSVRAGGTVGLIALTVYDPLRCTSSVVDADPRPAPKLGTLVTRVEQIDVSHLCKQMLYRVVHYRAGKIRGTDRFTLYLVGEDSPIDYQVTVHVR